MALAPYTVTALAESDSDGTAGKNIVSGAVITLTDVNGVSATIYDDASGTNPSTAKTTNTNGQRVIYADAGQYTLTVNGASSVVIIGADKSTTAFLISSTRGYQEGDSVETNGYAAPGDGGAAQWKATSTTGLTPSQNPLSSGGASIVDGSGRLWVKASDGVINTSQLGQSEHVIYVNETAGSDLNRGGVSSPLKTLQAAIDQLAGYGDLFIGQFAIELASGTYARGRFPDDGLKSDLRFIIRGPDVGGHPNVPTAIISEAASGSSVELVRARNGTSLTIKDIKLIGANGTTSSAGVSVSSYAELYAENVHADNCYWGLSVSRFCDLDVKGGIFENCGNLNGAPSNGGGTRDLFNCRHAIGLQSSTDLSNGPIFRNCDTACFSQEGGVGHADYLTIEDCNKGLVANVNSRFNYSGTQFRRNSVDVVADHSHVFASSADYGTGADESQNKVMIRNNGGSTGVGFFNEYDPTYSVSGRVYAIDRLEQVIQTLSETAFHTSTLPAGFWRSASTSIYPGRYLQFDIHGELSGTSDVKRVTLRIAGANLGQLAFTSSDTGKFYARAYIYFTDKEEQFGAIEGAVHLGTNRIGSGSSNNTMSSDVAVTIGSQVGNISDSVKINLVKATLYG